MLVMKRDPNHISMRDIKQKKVRAVTGATVTNKTHEYSACTLLFSGITLRYRKFILNKMAEMTIQLRLIITADIKHHKVIFNLFYIVLYSRKRTP